MYLLKPLPYSYSALEPYIDTHTLGLHHQKHQATYLKKLNALLLENNYQFQYPIEQLPKHLDEFPLDKRAEIAFNLGGVLNHDLYFNSMHPEKEKPNERLMQKINDQYGNYEAFLEEFKKSANSLRGSGYTFLVSDQRDNLEILNLSNQETPYSYNVTPLLALDLWEHAYYLNYQNKKDLYIDNFFEIVDYKIANQYFNKQ